MTVIQRWFASASPTDTEMDYSFYTPRRVVKSFQRFLNEQRGSSAPVNEDGVVGYQTLAALTRLLPIWIIEVRAETDKPAEYAQLTAAYGSLGSVRLGQPIPMALWGLIASLGINEIYRAYGPHPVTSPHHNEESPRLRSWRIKGSIRPVYRGSTVPRISQLPGLGNSGVVAQDVTDDPDFVEDPTSTEVVIVGGDIGSSLLKQTFWQQHKVEILVASGIALFGTVAVLAVRHARTQQTEYR